MHSTADKLLPVAKIVKSFGSGDQVLIRYIVPDTELVPEEPVFLLFDGLPVPFFIESINQRGDNGAIVRFFDSENLYAELAGKEIYLPRKANRNLTSDNFYDPDLLKDFSLLSPEGEHLGTVKSIYNFPGNPCVGVLTPGETGKELLIPLHSDLIVSINRKKRELKVILPKGLLEL